MLTNDTPVKRSFRYIWYLVVFLLTLELCLRFQAAWQWGTPFWSPNSFETLTINDTMGGRNRANAHFEKWRINSQGFQGPELQIPKPKGIRRIGVAGASEIFSLYESPGGDVTSRLRELLEQSVPGRFEVVNLATPGMTIPSFIELHERWIHKFDFDAIIYYTSPAMYLSASAPGFQGSNKGKHEHLASLESSGLDPLLPGKTWEMLRLRLPVWIQVKLKWYLIERERRRYPNGWVWDHGAPDERIALFREHLLDLIGAVEHGGTRVFIATHANRFRNLSTEEDSRYMVGWIRFYPRATGESLLDMEQKANHVIRDLGVKQDIPVVDVETAVGKDPDRFADFAHFTDCGASRASIAMREKILSLYQ